MQGNLHVRFGEGDEETCSGNGARRFIPTLPRLATADSNSPFRRAALTGASIALGAGVN